MKVTYRIEYPELSRNLKQMRQARGWSQQELAAQAGVAIATVQKLEQNGAIPVEVETIERIAESLSVAIAELTGSPDGGLPGWKWVSTAPQK